MKIFGIKLFILIACFFLLLYSCRTHHSFLEGRTICIDPGHGGTAKTDTFRVGPSGEREEWINLRVALYLKELLEKEDAKVILTRTEDVAVGLKKRALLAIENNADVFISIHHNATADKSVNFPIVYFHGNASENLASIQLGKLVIQNIRNKLFNTDTLVSLVSDHVIFPGSGTAVLRQSYGIPGIIGEASFFSNFKEEQKLKYDKYNKKEAEAYFSALKEFFTKESKPIYEKYSKIQVDPFPVLQEADRMSNIAKLWKHDFAQAKELYKNGNEEALKKALELFTRSARSFPDSWLAEQAHYYRATIFEKLGKTEIAEMERNRIHEHYAM